MIAEKLKLKELHFGFKPDGERRDGFNPGNVVAVHRAKPQSLVTKASSSASAPTSVTPVVPAPPRPVFEAEDDPAGASGSAEATRAEDTEDLATDNVAGLSAKGENVVGS